MGVDYRLLPHFQASVRRHKAARESIPERWRSDPRPECQELNEMWVRVVARAREHIDTIAISQSTQPALDDR